MDRKVHQPALELLEAVPAEVEAGAEVTVRVQASCPEGCDLRGGVVSISGPDEVVRARELVGLEGLDAVEDAEHAESGAMAEFVIAAPPAVGDVAWTIAYADEGESESDRVHEPCTLSVASTVVPHTTSVAVWDVPSPVVGSRFTVSVGIKCSRHCILAGELVEVRDAEGVKLGEGRLGDGPRPGTSALYEGEVELVAPDQPGVFSRSALFEASGSGLPHRGTSGDFTFRAVDPPKHTVTVNIVPKGIEAPLDRIEVFLGPYRAETDERGVARVGVSTGTYELSAWRVDMEPVSMQLEVRGEAVVEVEAEPRRIVDEDERYWG